MCNSQSEASKKHLGAKMKSENQRRKIRTEREDVKLPHALKTSEQLGNHDRSWEGAWPKIEYQFFQQLLTAEEGLVIKNHQSRFFRLGGVLARGFPGGVANKTQSARMMWVGLLWAAASQQAYLTAHNRI